MASEQASLPALAYPAIDQDAGCTSAKPTFWLHLPVLVLLTIVLVSLAYYYLPPPTVAVGPQDRRFIHDANALERFDEIGRWIRWTQAETHLALPLVAANTPLLFDLTLINSYPSGLPDPIVDIVVGERWITDLFVERPIQGLRHYRLLLPPQERAGWSVPVTLYSSTIVLEEDPRPIGVMLVEARLSPLAQRPLIPPLWQVLAMVICASASYLSLRGIGASRWLAWGIAALLVGALTLGLVFLHLQIAPYTMRLAGLLGLGALYALVVALLTERRMPDTHAQTQPQPGRAFVASTRIPLLMGIAFWLAPVYQLLLTADGAPNVTPYPPTFWVGALAFLSSVIGIGVLLDMGRVRSWQALLLGILAVTALVHLAIRIDFALGRSGPDFWILFRGTRDWFRGGSMYNLVAVQENHFGHVFKVPPFYGMLFLPFVQSDGLMILFWHRVINIVLLATTMLLLFRAYGVRVASVLGVGLLLLFNMRPVADTIAYGQIDILLLLLLCIALIAAQRSYTVLAGAAVALGTLFKLYPALLLVFFVVKRQWWALVGFAVTMLACNALAVVVVGWEMHAVYLFEVLPRIGGGTAWIENQTINGFVSRLFADEVTAEKFTHPLVDVLTYGSFLLALAGAIWLSRRSAEHQSPRFVLQFGMFVILMVLTVPAAWMHYQTIVIIPFFGLLLYSVTQERFLRWQAALLGIAYALIAYGNQWSFYDSSNMGWLTILGMSYKFYGLVLLFTVTVACLLDVQRGEAEHGTL